MINHFRLALIPLFIELLPRGVNRNWKRFEDRRFVSRLTTSPRLSAHCLAIAVSTVWKFNETGPITFYYARFSRAEVSTTVLPLVSKHNGAKRSSLPLTFLFSCSMSGGERSFASSIPCRGGTGEDRNSTPRSYLENQIIRLAVANRKSS